MFARYQLYVAVMLVVACTGGGDSPAPESVLIFADRGSIQCESDGISPETSAQTLITAGIDVLQSSCGIRTGVVFAAVCGGETGEIVVHEIRGVNLPTAEELGFRRTDTLVDPEAGTGFELVDCAD
jgi:hypothetical protein